MRETHDYDLENIYDSGSDALGKIVEYREKLASYVSRIDRSLKEDIYTLANILELLSDDVEISETVVENQEYLGKL